ncbi:MAG TPA: TIM barrel protein [Terriglobia bacterium]|nr:TIM barrel protein [Terriglobia bacterium]
MIDNAISRRAFLGRAGGAVTLSAAGTALVHSSQAVSKTARQHKTLRLGGPVFVESDDPAVLAEAHRDLGYRAAYAPQVKLTDKHRIQSIVKEFAARDVMIAEVGVWVNMMDPDDAKRRKNMATVQERLALADELGARCCVDIAGSYDPKVWFGPNPKNMSAEFIGATVEHCRALIDAVKPTRTKFSIEMMPFNFPSGPDDYVNLVKAVNRKAFGVHLDVCNVMNSPRRMYHNSAVIRECFSKLGRWILSCHAKDLKWEEYVQVCLREVIPGQGSIDYRAYLECLAQLPQDAPLMLEHLKTAGEYTEGRKYIQTVAKSIGLSFDAEKG